MMEIKEELDVQQLHFPVATKVFYRTVDNSLRERYGGDMKKRTESIYAQSILMANS